MPNSNGPLSKTKGKLKNDPREAGTSPPQRAIAEFDEGQTVHLALDPSVEDGQFHARFNGQTGTVVGTQGSAYKVQIHDDGVEKTIIAKSAHLKAQQQD
jgi:large subunit ribosomal protein L21e